MLSELLFYNKRKKILIDLLIALGVNIIIFACVLCTNTSIFAVNDDMVMRNIAAGGILGTPDGHLVFIKYALGALISGLYTLAPTLPWYGAIMYLCMFISLTGILYRCLNIAKNHKMLIVNAVCYCFLVLLLYRYIIFIQFTTVALMLGAACLFFFFSQDKEFCISDGVIIAIYAFLSFCVRYEVFLMSGTFMALFYVAKFIKHKKKFLKQGIIYAVIFGVIIGGVSLVEKAAYSDGKYQEYLAFNTARSNVYDFSVMPLYEDESAFYESINISYATYLCLQNYILEVGEDINTTSLNAIYEKSKTQSILTPQQELENTVKTVFSMYNVSRHIRLALIISIIFMIVAILLTKRKLLFAIGCLLVAALLTLVIVLSQRVIERVTICIIVLFFTAMMGIVSKHENYVFKVVPKKFAIIFTLIIGAGSLLLFTAMVNVSKVYISFDKEFLEDKVIIGDYMRDYVLEDENKDSFYFMDAHTLSNMSDTTLNGDNNTFLNRSYAGGWLSRSTMLYDGLDKYNMDYDIADSLANIKNTYFIGNKESADALRAYMKENYPENTMREVKSIMLYDTSENLIYEGKVYSFN